MITPPPTPPHICVLCYSETMITNYILNKALITDIIIIIIFDIFSYLC